MPDTLSQLAHLKQAPAELLGVDDQIVSRGHADSIPDPARFFYYPSDMTPQDVISRSAAIRFPSPINQTLAISVIEPCRGHCSDRLHFHVTTAVSELNRPE